MKPLKITIPKPVLTCLAACTLFMLSCAQSHSYRMELLPDNSVAVTSPDGAGLIYKPDFMVLMADRNPGKSLRRGDFGVDFPEGSQGLLYNVPTWGRPERFVQDASLHVEDGFNPEFDRAYGKNRTPNYFLAAPSVKLSAVNAVQKDKGTIEWVFDEHEGFTLAATITLSEKADAMPMIRMILMPKTEGWFSAGYLGAPEYTPADLDELWQAHIWHEKRFPNQPFLSESFRTSVPTSLVMCGGVTNGVVADPKYIPYTAETPNSNNSRFGVMVRNQMGNAQSILFAPVLGNADSKMESGKPFVFDMYLFQKKGDINASYEWLAYNLCDFGDIRRNTGVNLNTTIENMTEYCQSPYAMFIDSLRGFNYSTDVPGAVKNISGLHPLEFAILTDNEHLFRHMARPMLEYGLSRERFLFSPNNKVKGQNTSSRLDGPGVPVTDLSTTYTYSGDRVDYFLDDAVKLYEEKAVRVLNLDFISYEDRWLNSLALYRATGEEKFLARAIKDADAYLAGRVENKQTDYSDKYSLGWFFWTSFTNQWMELLQMYQFTGEKRFLDAAQEGARYYTQYCWVTPVPAGTVRVNAGGVVPKYRNDSNKFIYMQMPEEEVEAWTVSEMGLTPESSGTSSGHRGIFMAHHAPFMMRIAAETGDKFLHDMARAAVVGRYENFPGYHINAGRTNAFSRKDFPLRSQAELNGHTSIHYNHPASHVAMLWDYLFSDVYYVSGKQIDFPSEYSEGYAYCRSLIYGAHPGRFYDEHDVMPYMPAGMIGVSNVQANYLAGYGNGKLYVAVVNQSHGDEEVTLSFDPQKSFVDPAKEYKARIWKDNTPDGNVTVKEGKVTVKLKPRGIAALAIDGVEVQTKFQKKLLSEPRKWTQNHTSTGFEKDRAVLFDFGGDLLSVYVWNEADNGRFRDATLHYSIDGKWGKSYKQGYPYEFTVDLPENAEKFEYYFECTTPAGSKEKSATGTLKR